MYFLYEDGVMQFLLRDIDNTSHCLQLSNTTHPTGRRIAIFSAEKYNPISMSVCDFVSSSKAEILWYFVETL